MEAEDYGKYCTDVLNHPGFQVMVYSHLIKELEKGRNMQQTGEALLPVSRGVENDEWVLQPLELEQECQHCYQQETNRTKGGAPLLNRLYYVPFLAQLLAVLLPVTHLGVIVVVSVGVGVSIIDKS